MKLKKIFSSETTTILEEDHPMTIPLQSLVLIELLVPDKMVFM
jgi:hypothetical protein